VIGPHQGLFMFNKTNVTLETCPHDVAVTFSQMPALKGERPLRPARLAFLRSHLKAGTFVSPTWAVVVDKATGVRYRANGQHSSTVLAELDDAAYPSDLRVTIEEYTSDDLEADSFPIFDLFDNPSAARNNIDVMNLHRVYYPDLADVDAKLVLTLASGIALFEKGTAKGVFLPARERGAYLAREDYRQFILWAAPFAKAVHGWMLHKPGIVAEMLVQRRTDAETADAFWQLVIKESHPDADHETRELSRTLKDWGSKPKISQDRFRKETAKQWRRFRRLHATPVTPEHDDAPTLLTDSSSSASIAL
jgi:hypothetical protein